MDQLPVGTDVCLTCMPYRTAGMAQTPVGTVYLTFTHRHCRLAAIQDERIHAVIEQLKLAYLRKGTARRMPTTSKTRNGKKYLVVLYLAVKWP